MIAIHIKESGLQENGTTARGYDAFKLFRALFRELEWKT
jgi:hypothetical protein